MLARLLMLVMMALLVAPAAARADTRIKDLTSVKGIRANHLVGYGLVIGLNGTGDSLRNAPFTQQSMQSMLDRMGVNIRGAQARTRNIAAVMVMAELPAFAPVGTRIDLTVASMGDATSLAGGSLLMTPLAGADDVIYAVAQGQVVVSAQSATGRSAAVTSGVPTSARIPNGALVEREAPGHFGAESRLSIELYNPDFKTAVAISDAVNVYAAQRFRHSVADAQDMRIILLNRPTGISPARFLAEIGELLVKVDVPARIVIDERTGTIVIGQDVQIAPVAVAYGNVTVRVTETPRVSQPMPRSKGETVVVADTAVNIDERGGAMHMLNGPSLQSVVSSLNKIGLKPSGIIAVIQAIKSAGALNAELVVQ
jgi:flagellar P-ring protein precursor FlgI